MTSSDAIAQIAALGLEPTYTARQAAVQRGRSYSWLDQRLRKRQFVRRTDGTVVAPLRTAGRYRRFATEMLKGIATSSYRQHWLRRSSSLSSNWLWPPTQRLDAIHWGRTTFAPYFGHVSNRLPIVFHVDRTNHERSPAKGNGDVRNTTTATSHDRRDARCARGHRQDEGLRPRRRGRDCQGQRGHARIHHRGICCRVRGSADSRSGRCSCMTAKTPNPATLNPTSSAWHGLP